MLSVIRINHQTFQLHIYTNTTLRLDFIKLKAYLKHV